MNQPQLKPSMWDFLLAMKVGEHYDFENKPTRSEAMRKVPPSKRSAYKRVTQACQNLRRNNPGFSFKASLEESKGSRIEGNIVRVTLLAANGEVGSLEDFERFEQHQQQAREAWRKRKQAQEAPLLPGQLEQAECVEVARRTAGAVRRQMEDAKLKIVPHRYDPKKVAVLAVAHERGEVIERIVDGKWLRDPDPTWDEPTANYRIKPKIREWFLVVSRTGQVTAGAELLESLPHHDPECRVRVRELIEGEE